MPETFSPRPPRRIWLLIAAACLVPAMLAVFQAYMQSKIGGPRSPSWRSMIWEGSEWIIFGALTPLTYFLGRRLPLRKPHLARNLFVHICAALAVCFLWASGGASLNWLLGNEREGLTRAQYLISWTLTTLPYGTFMYFAVLGCVHAITYFAEVRERDAQTARLAAQLAEAKLGALRMQLHPHFLFNSLNAITVLVRDRDTGGAERMLELLSDTLRDVLRGDQRNEVPLSTELRFLERYLAIMQVRFSDRLIVAFDIAPDVLDAMVPSWLLQPLVENALRHGLAKRIGSGKLDIAARRDGAELVLEVRDDGPGPGAANGDSEGVGLANTRERLRTLYGELARLALVAADGGGTIATVRMPYRVAEAA